MPCHAVGNDQFGQRCRGLIRADALVIEAGGTDSAACLGAAHVDGRLGQGGQQLLALAGGIGGLAPAAHPIGRGDHDDVGCRRNDGSRFGAQGVVVLHRGNLQCGGMQHLRAPALQRLDEVPGPAMGRDTDPESPQGLGGAALGVSLMGSLEAAGKPALEGKS